MDAQALSNAGEVFDVVVMADVLEHLDDPASVLKIAVELLAPDGKLLVTVPNGKGPFEIESAFSKLPLMGSGFLKLLDLFVAVLNKTVMKGVWSRISELTPKDLPYNIDSGHVQFFLKDDLLKLFHRVGLRVTNLANGSFFSGPFTNYLFAPSQRFCNWNARFADHLPSSIVSSWFFECRRVVVEG
jgi:SAM-dependent methyltransferase